MQVSINWLKEYVDIEGLSVDQIAEGLTISGLEIEEIEKIGPKFYNIETVEIKELNPHPNADKLRLVTLKTKDGEKTVVCGAQNIEVGQIVPYASVGSKVFSRKTNELFELTPATIRGVKSEGMLCSADELGVSELNLQEEDGILILNRIYKDVKIGQKLEEILGIEEDTILHTAPTANRGDEMSIVGTAREISAIFDRKLNYSKIEDVNELEYDKFTVEIKEKELCKLYSVGILKDIKIKASPEWMKKRLLTAGIRSINNVVDITNYVLLEMGTPLHAFDLDKVGDYLCVRRGKEGEKIITLDGVERELSTETVLIADREKPVCVAGVFGGQNSEVDEGTKNIALEAAYFTPSYNRKSARSIGYRSEASARFERGIDLYNVTSALNRAIQLLIEYADAKFEGVVKTENCDFKKLEITLRFNELKRVLGCEIEASVAINILEKLGFTLLGKNSQAAKFQVPGFRISDVTREIDLIEEVARIYGYDKIEPTLPSKTQQISIDREEKIIEKINNMLLGNGISEAVSSSLIGEPLLKEFSIDYKKEEAVRVKNAQSEDFCMLRQSLVANMFQYLKYNYDNGQRNIKLFEIGKTYLKREESSERESGVTESRVLGIVLSGENNKQKWQGYPGIDFYSMKGLVENIFDILGLSNRIEYEKNNEEYKFLHPSKSARIMLLGKPKIELGFFGQWHPIEQDKHKIKQEVYLCQINLEAALNAYRDHHTIYKPISLFPEVHRDIAFLIEQEIEYGSIIKVIKKSISQGLLNDVEVFDIYQGDNIEEGFKSIAFRISLQDKASTLTDEIVNTEMEKLKGSLLKSYPNVKFRE